MKLWTPWRRREGDTITHDLDEAAQRNAANNTASAAARARLAAAIEAEQDQLRRNHLGHLLHDSLTIRRRHP